MIDLRANLAEVARAEEGIVSMYLFGSFAEGREHGGERRRCRRPSRSRRVPDGRRPVRLPVLLGTRMTDAARRTADVVILNDAPPQLPRAIVTRGQRLYCTDAALDHAPWTVAQAGPRMEACPRGQVDHAI